MALRIVKESDPVRVKQIVVALHGGPGNGKSTAAFSAEDPIVMDFDGGSYRAGNRKDVWQFDSWQDVCDLELSAFDPYKTVVIDTAGRALEMLALDIMQRDPKMGRGGQLSIQGYGALKSQFCAWLNLLKSHKKDIILVCHSEEKQRGEEVIERLDVVGGSKNEIYKSCDVMGRISVRDGKRTLNCNPDESSFGKNPAGLPILDIPDFHTEPKFLAKLIQRVKDAINAETEAQKPAVEFLETWKKKIDDAMTASDFNDLVKEIETAECSEAVRTLTKKTISEAAKGRGLAFNKKERIFSKAS